MSQSEITENQAEQNKSHAVAGIEAHPTPPHCCFFRNVRCNLAHADLQCGVTGREHWPPERIDEVDDSERKDNARTKNHETFCGQDASLFCGRIADHFQLCNDFSTCSNAPHSRFYSASSFDEIQSPAPARRSAFSWRKIAIALTTPESPLHWAAGRQPFPDTFSCSRGRLDANAIIDR